METGNNPNEERDEKIRYIWKIAVVLYVLVAMGFIFYWEFTDSGLPMMICELQASLFNGSCYIAFNILIPLLLALVPPLLIKLIIEKSLGISLNSSGDKKALF